MPITFNGNVVIASIFPMETPKVTRFHGRDGSYMSSYSIPAVEKGKVGYMTIYDSVERMLDYMQPSPTGDGRPATVPTPVFAEDIARDVLAGWVNMLMIEDGVGPGIAIIATNHADPSKAEATPEQLESMKLRQTRYFEKLYYDGNDLEKQQKMNYILPLHREAAKWIGRNASWVEKIGVDEIAHCPACTKNISSRAIICPECGIQIKAMPQWLKDLQNQGSEPERLPPPMHSPKSKQPEAA